MQNHPADQEPRRVLGSFFAPKSQNTPTWEQRKLDEAFDFTVPNNTLSRAELNQESGSVRNVHYGDVLIKYGSVLDAQNDELPFITGRSKDDFKGALLQNGDIIIADTAEDETTGKVCEIVNIQDKDVVAGLHTMVCRPKNKTAEGYFGYYMNSSSYHHQLLPLMQGIKVLSLSKTNVQKTTVKYPKDKAEQQKIADCLRRIDTLIMDAVDDGLIVKDPTRKAIIKGKPPVPKKVKYLNQFELHLLLSDLDLQGKLNWDWMILLIAKTGIRFSEALAITPADFDFSHQMLSINKTWDYKGNGGFLPTKNKSSVRKIQIDWQTVIQFAALVKDVPEDKPIFVFKEHAYNSTVNDVLERHCDRAKIPVISVHGLRHTHASVLLFAGVSIASVARRLGHSSMTTTQKTYLHIIQELENQDIDLVMRSLSGLS